MLSYQMLCPYAWTSTGGFPAIQGLLTEPYVYERSFQIAAGLCIDLNRLQQISQGDGGSIIAYYRECRLLTHFSILHPLRIDAFIPAWNPAIPATWGIGCFRLQ